MLRSSTGSNKRHIEAVEDLLYLYHNAFFCSASSRKAVGMDHHIRNGLGVVLFARPQKLDQRVVFV